MTGFYIWVRPGRGRVIVSVADTSEWVQVILLFWGLAFLLYFSLLQYAHWEGKKWDMGSKNG